MPRQRLVRDWGLVCICLWGDLLLILILLKFEIICFWAPLHQFSGSLIIWLFSTLSNYPKIGVNLTTFRPVPNTIPIGDCPSFPNLSKGSITSTVLLVPEAIFHSGRIFQGRMRSVSRLHRLNSPNLIIDCKRKGVRRILDIGAPWSYRRSGKVWNKTLPHLAVVRTTTRYPLSWLASSSDKGTVGVYGVCATHYQY